MDLNSILFPAPSCSFSPEDLHGELIWIPKTPTTDKTFNSAHLLHSFATTETRSQVRVLMSYNNHLQKKENSKAFHSVFKSKANDPGLDDLSIITTASSKKIVGVEKVKAKGGDFEDQEEEEKGSTTIYTKYVENGQSSEKESPASNSTPKRLSANSPNVKEREALESADISISCIEEPLSNLIPGNYARVPNTSFNNHQQAIKNSFEGFKTTPVIINSKSNTIDTSDGNKKPNNSLKFSLSKENQSKQFDPKANTNAKGQVNAKSKQLNRDQSMSSFDPGKIDEFSEQKALAGTPRSLPNYSTRSLSKPISEKIIESKPDNDEKDDSDIKFDIITDIIEEISPPGTKRKRLPQYTINPFLLSEKKPEMISSVLSPAPQKRFELHNYRKSETGFGMLKQTLNNQNLLETKLAEHKKTDMGYIPCRLLFSGAPASKIMIYFHGNGEDVNLAYELLSHIRNNLNIHVLAVEYPGYSLYKGTPNESQILVDSETVYNYLVTALNIKPQQIILFGRSIGSGPATYLASKKNVGALILMSAFTSIRSVVKDIAGSLAQFLIKERFNNLEAIAKVTCPTFLIHGQSDRLIPYVHSERLHDACKAPSELYLPKKMDHVEFDFYEDFTSPLIEFLEKCGFEISKGAAVHEKISFPQKLFHVPDSIKSLFKKEQKQEETFVRCKTEGPTVSVSIDLFR